MPIWYFQKPGGQNLITWIKQPHHFSVSHNADQLLQGYLFSQTLVHFPHHLLQLDCEFLVVLFCQYLIVAHLSGKLVPLLFHFQMFLLSLQLSHPFVFHVLFWKRGSIINRFNSFQTSKNKYTVKGKMNLDILECLIRPWWQKYSRINLRKYFQASFCSKKTCGRSVFWCLKTRETLHSRHGKRLPWFDFDAMKI